ncbi:OmpA family protein [Pseudochryseolinea flava]|uniref:OmpA-like domain-containing protein n=1 Tax=Pseudochryseolinea flava TaxID=2059302 RepID=A0A364Y8Q0_9BACT|nr:OmpA family protein [Pseudochryseolinea flava]RAW02739.1 hypothetical protein DQQ10_01125 [Pseudochryseolinea flava]
MIRILLLSAFFVSGVSFASAQSSFIPKNLGLAINTPFDETHPLISPDGSTLYFTRVNHPENNIASKKSSAIWISQRDEKGIWSAASLAPHLNEGKHNQVLSITNDSKQILLFNDKGLSLYDADKKIISPLKIKATHDASMTGDGKQIVFSKSNKLYLTERLDDATWSAPRLIHTFTIGKITSPVLLDDGTLFFSVTRKTKSLDLCKSKRIGTDWNNWETPVFLSDTINTVASESALHTTPNGAWGYYASVTATGKSDIFVVKLYEDHPYVLVSGRILNNVSKRSVRKKDVQIMIDGTIAKNFEVNKDSGTYQVQLPFGKKYAVVAAIDHYKPVSFTVDATAYREYTTMKLDLEEIPTPYVLLKGKTLIKNMDRPIPIQAEPQIVVDGMEVDSAIIKSNGEYELKLNHGTHYYVQVVAKRFESLPAILDLKDIDGYEVIELDLQADAEKMAIISGALRDRKTGQPLSSSLKLKVEVEGVESLTAAIDSLTGNYEIRLPLKEKHIIRITAEGYYPVNEIIDVSKETSEVVIAKDLTATPIERGQVVRLNTIDVGTKVDITKSYPELDSLAKFLTAHPKIRIELGAHVESGVKTSTLKVAQEIANYIASKGVARHRIASRGYGNTKPVASNKTPEGKLLNRRVEFIFLEL